MSGSRWPRWMCRFVMVCNRVHNGIGAAVLDNHNFWAKWIAARFKRVWRVVWDIGRSSWVDGVVGGGFQWCCECLHQNDGCDISIFAFQPRFRVSYINGPHCRNVQFVQRHYSVGLLFSHEADFNFHCVLTALICPTYGCHVCVIPSVIYFIW